MKHCASLTPLPNYRPNAGLCIVNAHNQVLACERADIPGAWQCPQGGIDANETPEQAAWRELLEETGIAPTQTKLIQTHSKWLHYDFPKQADSIKNSRTNLPFQGQAQKWFLFYYDGPLPKVEDQVEQEFKAYAWKDSLWVLENVAVFRKNIYASVFKEFKLL